MSFPPARLRPSAWPLHSLLALKRTPCIWVRIEEGEAGRLGQGKRAQPWRSPGEASSPPLPELG